MALSFHIPKEIIKLRTKFNLTQRQLAEKTGIKQPQIARIESGKQEVKLETLERIADSLGYSVEVHLIPKIDDELINRTLDAVIEENERMNLKKTDTGYELDTENFSLDSILFDEDEEEVTNDDENCWVEYQPPTD